MIDQFTDTIIKYIKMSVVLRYCNFRISFNLVKIFVASFKHHCYSSLECLLIRITELMYLPRTHNLTCCTIVMDPKNLNGYSNFEKCINILYVF